MTIRTLAEVGARLEEAVRGLPGELTSNADLYDRYEMVAIQTLDSEFMDHPPGALEEYLATFLQDKQAELGLSPEFISGETS